MSEFLTVKKDTLKGIIFLVDEAETLSEKLEKNNQELRILTHKLIKNVKRGNQLTSRNPILLNTKIGGRIK